MLFDEERRWCVVAPREEPPETMAHILSILSLKRARSEFLLLRVKREPILRS